MQNINSATKVSNPKRFSFPFFKSGGFRYLVLVAALVAWIFPAVSSVLEAYEGKYVLIPAVSGAMVALFYLGTLLFGKLHESERGYKEPEILLRNILIVGLSTLTISMLSLATREFTSLRSLGYFMEEVYPVLSSLPFILFLVWTFSYFRRFVDEQTEATRASWNWFIVILALSTVSAIVRVPDIILFAGYGIAGVIGFSLVLRVKWIADLEPSNRPYVLIYLFLITWVIIGLSLKFFIEDAPGIFHRSVFANPFPIILMAFNGIYSLVTLLAIIFNWPISSVIDQKNEEISTFQNLNKQINSLASPEEIQELLFDICCQNSSANAAWMTRPMSGNRNIQFLTKGSITVEEVSGWDKSIRSNQNGESTEFHYEKDISRMNSVNGLGDAYQTMLSFPITINGTYQSNLVLLKQKRDAFDPYTIRMLGTYVNQARLALEKNMLVSRAVENEKLKNDMDIAVRVQESLLPAHTPKLPWINLAVEYSPAQEVGGDYYDFFDQGETLYLIIGDVTGKGMGAAFNVAELKGIFHSNKALMGKPDAFMQRVNEAVAACFNPGVFLSMIYMGFHPQTNEYSYVRAGHLPILHYKAADQEVEYLHDTGLGIGIVRDNSYAKHIQVNRKKFEANDVLVLYTDGVVEALSPDGEEYGFERLQTVVARHAFFKAEEIKRRILDDVENWLAGSRAGDDITLLVIRFE
ncbi:MAG: sigma-B regulation protein RsbU (phosphoserine phosphatase) [Limisphaerales bacterium]|jgi:sigma-B regulation protein RsbU (phosphoserine phosphatase)